MPIFAADTSSQDHWRQHFGEEGGGCWHGKEGMLGELGEALNANDWNGEQSVAPRSQMEVRGGRLSPPNQITEKREAEGIDPNFC